MIMDKVGSGPTESTPLSCRCLDQRCCERSRCTLFAWSLCGSRTITVPGVADFFFFCAVKTPFASAPRVATCLGDKVYVGSFLQNPVTKESLHAAWNNIKTPKQGVLSGMTLALVRSTIKQYPELALPC